MVSSYIASNEAARTAGMGAAQQSEEMLKYETCRRMLQDFGFQSASVASCEKFESKVKEMFIREPGRMKLLIVVDKLLTGFDAPPATYLYIDKKCRITVSFRRSAVSIGLTARARSSVISSTTRLSF